MDVDCVMEESCVDLVCERVRFVYLPEVGGRRGVYILASSQILFCCFVLLLSLHTLYISSSVNNSLQLRPTQVYNHGL
jgi:hypothetical protein